MVSGHTWKHLLENKHFGDNKSQQTSAFAPKPAFISRSLTPGCFAQSCRAAATQAWPLPGMQESTRQEPLRGQAKQRVQCKAKELQPQIGKAFLGNSSCSPSLGTDKMTRLNGADPSQANSSCLCENIGQKIGSLNYQVQSCC